MNVVLLQGILSSEPRHRTLPSGTELVNWELTTDAGGARHTVPVAWFDPTASVRATGAGDQVVVLGMVRRRFYRADGRTVSRTEVVGERCARAGRHAQVARLWERVADALEMSA